MQRGLQWRDWKKRLHQRSQASGAIRERAREFGNVEALCSETQLQEAGIQDDGPRQGPWGPNEAANSGGDQDVKNEGRR